MITYVNGARWVPSLSHEGSSQGTNFFRRNEPRPEISNNVVCATSKASDQPAHTLVA